MNTKQQEEIVLFLKNLRDEIIHSFESLEPNRKFERKAWDHHSGGGGEISTIRGDVFEKAAVNWSGVSGDHFPMNDGEGPFFATGVSLITHMMNPYAPTVHMNVRFIQTKNRFWFAGGFDLTPMGFSFDEDKEHFHKVAKDVLDSFDTSLYPLFKKNAADYFYIPHRKKERGVGGIFFDHYNTGNFENDFKMWKAVGNCFIQSILPIYQKRIHHPFSQKDKDIQNLLRAHYVEFNLIYDRGTKFGFQSGGNPEAILCSMPPNASW